MASSAHGKSSVRRLAVFGCGYIGSAVAAAARARGWDVVALTRNPATAAGLRAPGLRVVVADVASPAWHAEIGATDLVLDCVAGGGGGVDAYRHSYHEGMKSIVQWARTRGKPHAFVYTSSTSVYPQGGGAVVTEETTPLGGSERADILVATEQALLTGDAASRAFVLRLAGIYGPDRHYLLDRVRAGEVAGDGSHRLNLAHRDDIVAAIMMCFDGAPEIGSQVFNVADDAPTAKRDVVTWLAERLGVPVPRFTGQPAGGRRAVTPDRIIANAKLRRVLGWQPKFPSFREGYAELLQSPPEVASSE